MHDDTVYSIVTAQHNNYIVYKEVFTRTFYSKFPSLIYFTSALCNFLRDSCIFVSSEIKIPVDQLLNCI